MSEAHVTHTDTHMYAHARTHTRTHAYVFAKVISLLCLTSFMGPGDKAGVQVLLEHLCGYSSRVSRGMKASEKGARTQRRMLSLRETSKGMFSGLPDAHTMS